MKDAYEVELERLKRAAARYTARSRTVVLVCCVCSAKPAPETRFGPRCEKHRPADPEETP